MKRLLVIFALLIVGCTPKLEYHFGDRVKFHDDFYGIALGTIDAYDYYGLAHLRYYIQTEGHIPNLWVDYANITGRVEK